MFWCRKYTRAVLVLTVSSLATLTSAGLASAQSTPTELVDLSLEDLLNMDVSEDSRDQKQKRWEFGLSYNKGSFGGYRSGTQELSFQNVLFSPGETRTGQNYPIVPTFICQKVVNISATYNISERTSLSVTVPYINQATDHISSVPGFQDFILKTKGIGDISVMLAHGKKLSDKSHITGVIGTRLPTGSINETGDTPRNGPGTLERLPYTMQLGSGTFDFTGSVTYTRNMKDVTGGLNVNGTLRTGENENNYRLGNNMGASVFARYTKHPLFQPGLRLSARHISQINGGDTTLQVPAAFPFPAGITDPSNYGGEKVSVAATVKSCINADCSVSVTAEYSEPIYQHLNGVQPMERNSFSLGTSLKF